MPPIAALSSCLPSCGLWHYLTTSISIIIIYCKQFHTISRIFFSWINFLLGYCPGQLKLKATRPLDQGWHTNHCHIPLFGESLEWWGGLNYLIKDDLPFWLELNLNKLPWWWSRCCLVDLGSVTHLFFVLSGSIY